MGASAVHGIAGLWSMVAVGLFAKTDNIEVSDRDEFKKNTTI